MIANRQGTKIVKALNTWKRESKIDVQNENEQLTNVRLVYMRLVLVPIITVTVLGPIQRYM